MMTTVPQDTAVKARVAAVDKKGWRVCLRAGSRGHVTMSASALLVSHTVRRQVLALPPGLTIVVSRIRMVVAERLIHAPLEGRELARRQQAV